MTSSDDLRELLESVAAGELAPALAEAQLGGYVTGEAGRFDAAREHRTGIPEAILGDGKTTAEIVSLASDAFEAAGHVLITRIDPPVVDAVRERIEPTDPAARFDHDERARVLTVHGSAFAAPELDGAVGVVTGGTSDAGPAGEAAAVIEEMGIRVHRIEDVGVAGLARTIDALPSLREMDALVVAAGREGALPTVLAGLVDVPIIGLPVSNGYGHGGAGEAALLGMLQSCTTIAVVNIDAGFVAGAQAGLIARGVAGAREAGER